MFTPKSLLEDVWEMCRGFLIIFNTSGLKCMFGCLFYRLVLFKLFSSVVAVKIAEMIANDYTPCGLIFYSIGLYVHTHLYVENHQYLCHCTEFFDAAVVTQCMYILYTNIASLFCWSLLIFLPFKQYFAFKLLSPCKILSTHIIFLSSYAIPSKFSAVLFPVPQNHSYFM